MSRCENLDGQCAKSWCNCDEVRAREAEGSFAPATLLAGLVEMQPHLNKLKERAMIKAIGGGSIEQSKVAALSNAAWHLSMAKLYLSEVAS